jgi:plastocyanin
MMRTMTTKRWIVVILCVFALAVGLAACGGDDDDSSSSNATSASTSSGGGTPSVVAVVADNFSFKVSGPVAAGQSFQVQNKDDTEHTFTADDGAFDVDLPSGKTVTVPAQKAGTYKFHCKIHSSMTGTLDVS